MRLKLRSGIAGKAKIQVQGRGVHLDLASLPAAQPVTVQLEHGGGTCWEAVYGAPAQRDDAVQFKNRADSQYLLVISGK